MAGCLSASGEGMRADFGRGESGAGAGDGKAEFLAKGLFRHRGPFGAGALMVLLVCGCRGRCDGVTLVHPQGASCGECSRIKQEQPRVRSVNYNYVQGGIQQPVVGTKAVVPVAA